MQRNVDSSPRGALSNLTAGPGGSRSSRAGCVHALGQYLLRSAKSTGTYRDGVKRPVGDRGGRLVVQQYRCVWAAGHAGDHTTVDGRAWS